MIQCEPIWNKTSKKKNEGLSKEFVRKLGHTIRQNLAKSQIYMQDLTTLKKLWPNQNLKLDIT